jgi:hypothetical protein
MSSLAHLGKRETQGNYLILNAPDALRIAEVPDGKMAIHGGNYETDPDTVMRLGIGTVALVGGTHLVTDSWLKTAAVAAVSVPVALGKPVWRLVQGRRQDSATRKALDRGHWRFPYHDIPVGLAPEDDEVDFVAETELQAPAAALLAATEGIPGVDVEVKKGAMRGTVNPGAAVRFMLTSGDESSPPGTFLLDATSSLAGLDRTIKALPRVGSSELAPELQPLDAGLRAQVLRHLLATTGTFLMHRRLPLASRLREYGITGTFLLGDETVGQGPNDLAEALTDPSHVVTMDQVKAYHTALPVGMGEIERSK